MNKQDILRKQYGWSAERQEWFLENNSSIGKGSFIVSIKSKKPYWYYQYSKRAKSVKGNKRSVYLCPCKDDKSFSKACQVLVEKVQTGQSITARNKSYLSRYRKQYHDLLQKELESGVGRSAPTLERLKKNSTYFLDFCDKQNVRLPEIQTKEFIQTLKDYVKELKDRDLARATIRVYLQDARYYLSFICSHSPYELDGLGIYTDHIYTQNIQNEILRKVVGRRIPNNPPLFKKEHYIKIRGECLTRVRDIWIGYCKNEGNLERVGYNNLYGNFKSNQDKRFIGGEDLVKIISLLQLYSGCRVGEILKLYKDRETFEKHHNLNYQGSFLEQGEEGVWIINIHNSKRTNRRLVPITETIFSWDKPPIDESLYKTIEGEGNRETRYETPLMVVIKELFRQQNEQHYLIPKARKHLSIVNKDHRSMTHYQNEFKKVSKSMGWNKYDVNTTHNLRSLFISYMVSVGANITLLCNLLGHTQQTMMKYYLRDDVEAKIEMKASQREIIKSYKELID